jgi:hypothetical protein
MQRDSLQKWSQYASVCVMCAGVVSAARHVLRDRRGGAQDKEDGSTFAGRQPKPRPGWLLLLR